MQDPKQGSVCYLYRTCIICQTEKPVYEFKHYIRGGKRIKVRSYCNDCREKHSEEEIRDIINQIVNPKKTIHADPTKRDSSLLVGDEILVIGYQYKWKEKFPLEHAVRIVEEGLAEVIGSTAVRILFDDRSLKEYVLSQYNYLCADCGKPATRVTRIVPKSEGGLKTPKNLKAICDDCIHLRQQSEQQRIWEQKWKRVNIDYAVPVYLNDSTDIHQVIENPPDFLLDYVRDPKCIHYFCDVSEYSNQGIFGIAVVEAGQNRGIRVYTRNMKGIPGKTSLMELNAVHWALKILRKKKAKKFSVYSDTNVLQFRDPITKSLLLPNVRIHFLSQEEQKHPLYRMAHHFSRYATKSISMHNKSALH